MTLSLSPPFTGYPSSTPVRWTSPSSTLESETAVPP